MTAPAKESMTMRPAQSAALSEASSSAPSPDTIRLGLIGDNIAASRSPALHEASAPLIGRTVRYDRLVPRELGLDFDGAFARAQAEGFRGLNITYPYKERVVEKLRIEDPRVARLGAVNTVLFEAGGPVGWNTDFTGFMAAYRSAFADHAPGVVCMIGAGGVGKAVAYGLIELGATEIRLVERDLSKAQALAAALSEAAPGLRTSATDDAEAAAAGADGVVNSTPVGMDRYPGTPLPRAAMRGASWAFDAVYTPMDTRFLRDAEAEGLRILSGYELFFYQALHAFALFHGTALPEAAMRDLLARGAA
jgi:shikimate dehydrogenase